MKKNCTFLLNTDSLFYRLLFYLVLGTCVGSQAETKIDFKKKNPTLVRCMKHSTKVAMDLFMFSLLVAFDFSTVFNNPMNKRQIYHFSVTYQGQ